ncbi:uncharacterized protein FFB20_03665 [Fusarium fujikuroi]|nr:uncharacterized protein FPRN_00471 [Fusarium proliferatum]SCN70072.1 uncharacterized protein FFB20_03665 [Fusarium fujikuroi]SCN73300.1 uncharacterized protein FFC1_01739 [Fusarium fujikuroi]SCO07598.1 uncharacterized protein FFE2_11315 [Fusarium fujikuroi]SCO11550.1 uncharacterized protein FFM5_10042 [Fusarium fujikuroi]
MPDFAKSELSVLSPSYVAASGEALITSLATEPRQYSVIDNPSWTMQ